RNCCSFSVSAISREAPLRLAFERSPRFAASAAPAAICCFFDLAGMTSSWQPTSGARPKAASVPRKMCTGAEGSGGSTWRNADGSQGEAWVVAYTDFEGKRRIRSFEKKRDADAFHASVAGELRAGLHVPDSQSVTVAEAGRLRLEGCGQPGERHIPPVVGAVKLSRLTVPMVRAFEDKLALDRSLVMVRKARVSLGALLTRRSAGWSGRTWCGRRGRAAAGARTHV